MEFKVVKMNLKRCCISQSAYWSGYYRKKEIIGQLQDKY
jgi:hypothetical protein